MVRSSVEIAGEAAHVTRCVTSLGTTLHVGAGRRGQGPNNQFQLLHCDRPSQPSRWCTSAQESYSRATRVPVPASSNSLWATCAATGGGEQSSEAGEDEENSAAGDWEDGGEGDCGGASLGHILP